MRHFKLKVAHVLQKSPKTQVIMEKVKEFFYNLISNVKQELFRMDRTCNNCGREIFGDGKGLVGENLFCEDCFKNLPLNSGSICAHCGRSLDAPTNFCDDCKGTETSYKTARSCFYYAPPIDGLIRKLKYSNKKYLVEVLGVFLTSSFLQFFTEAEYVTFVPSTKKSKRKRGYNQAELLANEVARRAGVICLDLLEKTQDTVRQATLDKKQRLKNIKGTIKVRNRALVKGKTVVVIDDVLTTGATAETVSSVLKKAGAKTVYMLTVASVTNPKIARALGQERSESATKKERQFKRKLAKQQKKAKKHKNDDE